MTDPDLAERRGVETVYQPAEDSRLLADAALEHVDAGDRVLEVGTGSGYVAEMVAEAGARVVATDVNPHATRAAREAGLEAVRADLLDPFTGGAFDAVLFNPPYLPTDPDAEWDDWMERALSGGETGRAVIDPFVADVGRVLAPGGQALLVVSSLSDVEQVIADANARGFSTATVAEESFPFERLVVVRMITDNNQSDR